MDSKSKLHVMMFFREKMRNQKKGLKRWNSESSLVLLHAIKYPLYAEKEGQLKPETLNNKIIWPCTHTHTAPFCSLRSYLLSLCFLLICLHSLTTHPIFSYTFIPRRPVHCSTTVMPLDGGFKRSTTIPLWKETCRKGHVLIYHFTLYLDTACDLHTT